MNKLALTSLIVAGSAFVAAPQALAALGGACSTDAECADGVDDRLACLSGVCAVRCDTDAACDVGEHCLHGGCFPDVLECTAHEHCVEPEVCRLGTCEIPQCLADSECGDGEVCHHFRCIEEGTEPGVGGVNVDRVRREAREKYLGCSGGAGPASGVLLGLSLLGLAALRRRFSGSPRG